MKFTYTYIMAFVMSCCFIVGVLLTSVDFHAMNISFYESEFEKLDTADKMQMEDEQLVASMDALLLYLQGNRDDLSIEANVAGYTREVYNDREITHMVDVKDLYLNAMNVRNVCTIVFLLLLAILVYKCKKQVLEILSYTYVRACIVFLFAITCIALYAVSDFTAFWTMFHQIFFSNDLWLLDPNTSLMINMLEEQVFYDLVTRICISFALFIFTPFIASLLYTKRCRKIHLQAIEKEQ